MDARTVAPASDVSTERVVVLGVGNLLLSDEGVGVRLVERLEARYRLPESVRLLDGGTCAMEMLEDLEDLDLLVIADCVRSGQAPGALVVLRDEQVPAFFRTKLSPHQVGLSDVLATLQFTGRAPARVVVVGVEPASLATGMALSGPVEACLPAAEDALVAALASAGVVCRLRDAQVA